MGPPARRIRDGIGEPGGHVLAVVAVTQLGVEAVQEDPVAGEEALGARDDGGEVGPGERRGRAGVAAAEAAAGPRLAVAGGLGHGGLVAAADAHARG